MSAFLAATCILACALAVMAAPAADFWSAKDWRKWSAAECNKMLHDSPWSRKWSYSEDRVKAGGSAGSVQDVIVQVTYYAQLRSALPVREAVIRQMQIDRNYEKLGLAERQQFDDAADLVLNQTYADSVLVHVTYDSNDARYKQELDERKLA